MIRTFAHKGLRILWEQNNHKGVDPQYAKRLRLVLTALNAADVLDDLRNTPGLDLHPLKGNRAGVWSLRAYANYRVTFQWMERSGGNAEAQNVTIEEEPELRPPEESEPRGSPNPSEPPSESGDAYDVNLEDYHSGRF
jgi:proteic killer suppression protein